MGLFDRFLRRETAAERASWVQSLVSSAAARAQQSAVSQLRAAQRGFEAAETPAWTSSWSSTTADINQDLAAQLPTMRARAIDLARNNEWAAGYLIQLEDNVLGAGGIRMQGKLTLSDRTTPDNIGNTLLESAWARWGARGHCETSGKLTWREVEAIALSSLARTGELLYRLRPGAGGIHNFKIQILNPILLDVTLRRDWGKNRVRMGVEINDDGAPVAYWLTASLPGDAPLDGVMQVGRHVRVPAEQIRHCYLVEEPDQLRGIPWLAIGARRLWLNHDFEEAAAVASSNAAKRQGFFISPTGDAPPGFADTIISGAIDAARAAGKTLTAQEIQDITTAAQKFNTVMPGQFDTVPQGYDFREFESKWPDVSAGEYVKANIRGWSVARGASYVTLGNDLEAVNYSSARVGIVAEREHYKSVQQKLIDWLHADVAREWIKYAAAADNALLPSRLPAYQAGIDWQPRRWEGIDPVKDANANETNLKMGLTSRRRIIAARGDDADEIFTEIENEKKQFGDLNPDSTPAPAVEPDGTVPKKSRHLAAVRSRE